MDCRTALEILDCQGAGLSRLSESDLAAANAHLAECSRCRTIAHDRRRLDRKIGRVMRAVVVPRDAQERLLAQLAELEAAATGAAAGSQTETAENSSIDVPHEIHRPPTAIIEHSQVVEGPRHSAERSQRRMWRTLVPVSACAAVAAIAFFSAIWLMTPRWSVEEVRVQLSGLDFDSLETLKNFQGEPAASQLPADPGWHKLDWRCRQIAKGWPDTSGRHQFAVYGFLVPSRQRHAVRGLLAVVPRRQVSAPPEAQSIGAAPSGEYFSARLGEGEAVRVAWTEGDVVYVCLVVGGEEPLTTLRQMLGASAT
ncbi:MAG TPA: hypothetical protein VHX68_13860 [Planctomycetaceae bacterium]|jgi:hypothetical protein|nr:hypothetical protein [Planctomycetaceae bacterium]